MDLIFMPSVLCKFTLSNCKALQQLSLRQPQNGKYHSRQGRLPDKSRSCSISSRLNDEQKKLFESCVRRWTQARRIFFMHECLFPGREDSRS